MSIRLRASPAALLAVAFVLSACSRSKPADDALLPASQAELQANLSTMATDTPPAVTAVIDLPTPTPTIVLPDLGPAPDITNEVWLNTDRPLNMAALDGKVVLVEFWTFG